jgi:hypothetical protein
MRLVTLFLMLGLCASVVMAAPGGDEGDIPEGKQFKWPPGWFADRETYPEQEPNQPCGNDQPVNCGDVVDPGCIDSVGDHDWYAFEATEGDEITCGTDESLGLPTVDTFIELYADDCVTQLTYDDDGGPGLYSLISEFEAPYTGTYHLLVRSYGDYYTGCYLVFFECGEPPHRLRTTPARARWSLATTCRDAPPVRSRARPRMITTTTARRTTAPATAPTATTRSTTWISRKVTTST